MRSTNIFMCNFEGPSIYAGTQVAPMNNRYRTLFAYAHPFYVGGIARVSTATRLFASFTFAQNKIRGMCNLHVVHSFHYFHILCAYMSLTNSPELVPDLDREI